MNTDFNMMIRFFKAGGLNNFDEQKRVKAELDPIIEQLRVKALELNVPMSLIICSNLDTISNSGGIVLGLREVSSGRVQRGRNLTPALFKALRTLAQDPSKAKVVLGADMMEKLEGALSSYGDLPDFEEWLEQSTSKTQKDIDMDKIIEEGTEEE